MFIELLVVGLILTYLYGTGLIDFSSPFAIAITVVLALVASAAGYLVTHFLARRLVDSMFGFDRWSPQVKKPDAKQQVLDANALKGASADKLRKLVEHAPEDVETSRVVSKIYRSCRPYPGTGMRRV
jgi:hypothetical protein